MSDSWEGHHPEAAARGEGGRVARMDLTLRRFAGHHSSLGSSLRSTLRNFILTTQPPLSLASLVQGARAISGGSSHGTLVKAHPPHDRTAAGNQTSVGLIDAPDRDGRPCATGSTVIGQSGSSCRIETPSSRLALMTYQIRADPNHPHAGPSTKDKRLRQQIRICSAHPCPTHINQLDPQSS